jgi:protein pelota
MMTECVRREDRVLIENKRKFILCRASSGHKHALEEIFADPTIGSQLEDTKMASEVSVLRQFVRWMDVDPDRALYGYGHVLLAQDSLAIEDLLLTDQLLRNSRSVVERRKYVKLVEDVRASGGTVHVFSSLHVSGKQLNQLSGIAAILRYPMPEIAAGEIEDDHHEGGESGLPDEFAEDASDEEYDPEKRIREDTGFN